MKVGILGSGDVAKTLAGGFLKHGHDAMMGTRTPAKLTEWAAQSPNVSVGSFADAAVVGSAIVQCIEQNPGREAAAVSELLALLTANAEHAGATV